MYLTQPILAQVSSASPEVAANSTTSTVVVGFLFVMVVLTTLAAITSAIGACFSKQAAREAARAAEASLKAAEALAKGETPTANTDTAPAVSATAPHTQTDTPSDSEEDPVLLAVIAAAVHTVIGDRAHRVVSVRSAGPGWAQEGRRQIFSSHRVR